MTAASVFAGLMVSDAPRAEFEEVLRPFAPLIGSWDLDVSWYDDDGQVSRETKGEWHFAYALDGRAVADIWITPSRAQRPIDGDGEWGLSVRLYDPTLKAFRSTWMGPANALVKTFIAHAADNTITLETPGPTKTRWAFTNLTPTTFNWRNEDEDEKGVITLRQRFQATRSTR